MMVDPFHFLLLKKISMLKPLSLRLHHIVKHVSALFAEASEQQWIHVWDCCCDHGLLGQHILKQQASSFVHFVDKNPGIMQTLSAYMQNDYQAFASRFALHQLDAHQLDLSAYKHQEHIVILAGVGGRSIIDIIASMRIENTNTRFVLCPQYHCYELRQYLMRSEFSLLQESYVYDRKQHYEIISVTPSKNQLSHPLTLTGDFWQPHHKAQQSYLSKLLSHYQHSHSEHPHDAYANYLKLANELQSQH